jgi:uncharacterized membrane protein
VSEAQPPPDDPEARRPGFGLYVHASSGELEFERVAFFSDAVFAIAVTLLIINVHVPASVGTGPAAARFARGLGQQLGQIISWALSFYVVARVWIGHHTLFRYLREIDARLLGLNLLFLALVAFLPYATAVLGDWGNTGPGAAFYAASMAAVGLVQSALWFHARRAGLTSPSLTAESARAYLLHILTFPAVFLVSVPVAFLSPTAAEIMWGIVALTRGLVRRRFLSTASRSGPSPA